MAEKQKSERLTSPSGIVSFPHVFEPHAINQGDEPKYSLILVFDNLDVIKELRQKCVAAADAKFGREAWKKFKEKGKFRFPWRPGSDYDEYGAPFDTDGAYFCSFSSKSQPEVVNRQAKPILKAQEIYAGCKARVTYAVWAYDSNGNKGVTLLLNNVQKTGDGPKLSGKPSGADDFDVVEGEDGADDDTGIEDDDI